MRRFWLFRSNLLPLEPYHKYTDYKDFKKFCHDFYLLMPLWFIENDYYDEVIIWRLTKHDKKDIVFEIDGRKFIQRWVKNFTECIRYPKPEISLFRGGFPEYCKATRTHPNSFGYKLYLGAGPRLFEQYGGIYDGYLLEDEGDFREDKNCIPFYKTAAPSIFYPYDQLNPHVEIFDICWPFIYANNHRKGQEEFIRAISKSKFLQSLKIVHCGNRPERGKLICNTYGVNNIKHMGKVDVETLSYMLNHSRLGLCMSNKIDGCPRVMTETLMTGTPLILNEETRLLPLYKKNGVVVVNINNVADRIQWALENLDDLKRQVNYAIKNTISMDSICKKNINRWRQVSLV
jgi:hypothetical protein